MINHNFDNENKVKYLTYVPKKCCKEKHVDSLLIREEGKRHYVLTKDFIFLVHLCMIIHYIVEENIFVAIVYKLLVQKRY